MIVKISGKPINVVADPPVEIVKEQPIIKPTSYLPGMVFTFNEPTTFILICFGLGVVTIIGEYLFEETSVGETIRKFRTQYTKYIFPGCVVATGVWAFVKCVKIML